MGKPVDALWRMRNGYALCGREGLEAISEHLATLHSAKICKMLSEAGSSIAAFPAAVADTTQPGKPGPRHRHSVRALPLLHERALAPLAGLSASLGPEAAYEATIWATVLNANRGASNIVLLTQLGGGAFCKRGRVP